MKINALLPGKSGLEILCDSYLIENLESFEELIEVYNLHKEMNPEKTIIVTLDNLGQAEYTSVHSTMSNDLDVIEGYDLSGIDKECFENGEHLGYLSTPSEFFILKENFLKQVKDVDFLAACDKGLTIDEDELAILEEINQSPFNFLDKEIILRIVPVKNAYEGVCGFPNGYFASDLDPFENYALAKHLFEKYGLELFGIGASFLGFIMNRTLDVQEVQELGVDLSNLYDTTPELLEKLLKITQEKGYLFLKYVEYLDH